MSRRFLSLGLGVQSTAIYFMASMGQLPRMEAAIFADLGKEKKGTIDYLEYVQEWQQNNNGIPITVIRTKNLYEDLLNYTNSTGQRFSSIPAYTRNDDGSIGMLRRQCTNEYKIAQVDRAIRNHLGVKTLLGQDIEVWKGISLDEIDRTSIPQELWKTHVYPYCGIAVKNSGHDWLTDFPRMRRSDIVQWYIEMGLPIPPKSACVFCPYQSEAAWYQMKTDTPENFEAACKVDEAIRNSSKKGNKQPIFLHESLTPLRDHIFTPGAPDLWHGECSGGCHT